MNNEKVYFRAITLLYFRESKNAIQTAEEISTRDARGDSAVNERITQKWLKKFRDEDFSLVDDER
ncbi:hypothetical protein EAI_12787, partial [Harpegnathos saltator]